MLSRWARTWHTTLFLPILLFLQKAGVSPNALTFAGLVASILAGFLISRRALALGAGVILLGGLCDSLDGELARLALRETPLGSFLDSISDHYGDFAVYLGLLWLYLGSGERLGVLLTFAAMFGSLAGSQVRSRAGMLGIDLKTVGVFTRMERTLVLMLGLLIQQVTLALWVLAFMNNFSALQRALFAIRAAGENA